MAPLTNSLLGLVRSISGKIIDSRFCLARRFLFQATAQIAEYLAIVGKQPQTRETFRRLSLFLTEARFTPICLSHRSFENGKPTLEELRKRIAAEAALYNDKRRELPEHTEGTCCETNQNLTPTPSLQVGLKLIMFEVDGYETR